MEIMPALPHCKHQVLKEKERGGGEVRRVLRQREKEKSVDVSMVKGCA